MKAEGTRMDWHLGGIGAQQVYPTSDIDGYIQIKEEKHFHPGNTAVGQWDSVVLPTGRMCYSSFHSTSAEPREKLQSTRS